MNIEMVISQLHEVRNKLEEVGPIMASAREELGRMRLEVEELKQRMRTCLFCRQLFATTDQLKEHSAECPDHPLNRLKVDKSV